MSLKTILVAALLLTCSPALSWADARGEARSQVGFGIEVAQRRLWREALYRFERAVAIDPTYAAAYNNLAVVYEQLRRLDKAREAYERALTLDPRNTQIRQNHDLFQESMTGMRPKIVLSLSVVGAPARGGLRQYLRRGD